MKKIKIYIFLILLIFQFVFCNKAEKQIQAQILKSSKLTEIVLTNIFSSQNNLEVKNIFTSNFKTNFNTNSINEIIGFTTLDSIFISDFKLISLDFDSFQFIADGVFIGNFQTNSKININQNIRTFTFILKAKNIYFVETYIDSTKHSFLNEEYNKTLIVNKLCLWDSTNRLIKYNFSLNNFEEDQVFENTGNYNFLDTLFLDYHKSEQSIYLNSAGNLFAISKNNIETKILIGNFNIENKQFNKINCSVNANYYDIKNNKSENIIYSGKLIIDDKKIILDSIIDIYRKIPENAFVKVKTLDTNIVLDIRYATTNNFTKTQLYDCEQCLLRYSVAKDLVLANKEFMENGVKIKIFDGYRPHSVQYKMWEVVPNINYVANPDKGSIHNRGGAVDVSLVDFENQDVDMGTEYDFFGKEAFHAYIDFSDTVLQNRLLLKNILQKHNFSAIKTEWWHYSHRSCMLYEISDFKLPCE